MWEADQNAKMILESFKRENLYRRIDLAQGCVYEQLSNQYYIDDVLRAFFRPANDPANRGNHYSVTRNLMSYSHHFMSINVEDTDDVRNYCTFLRLQVG